MATNTIDAPFDLSVHDSLVASSFSAGTHLNPYEAAFLPIAQVAGDEVVQTEPSRFWEGETCRKLTDDEEQVTYMFSENKSRDRSISIRIQHCLDPG